MPSGLPTPCNVMRSRGTRRVRTISSGLLLGCVTVTAVSCAARDGAAPLATTEAPTDGGAFNAGPGNASAPTTDAAGHGDDAPSEPVEAGNADASGGGPGLASNYPGDVGIGKDPAVVWDENFEEGSVSLVTARYDNFKNPSGMVLLSDIPPKSGGSTSMQWTAGVNANATDLFKKLPNHDELYTRWYAKYQAGIQWHHTGVWFGGYDPPSTYPNPQAGLKPNGDDRFSVSIEPVFGIGTASPRLDFYNYWMQMHSWMDAPSGTTAYYGNALVHQNAFTVDQAEWMCIEVHVKLNTDVTSAAGAVLEVWKDDALVQHFDASGPLGYWIKDKFCPTGADGPECTDYPSPANTTLNLQFRNTSSLQLNAFWPQNYITSGPDGNVQFDDMVVATERIGCLR
jgi:hypothetical protein